MNMIVEQLMQTGTEATSATQYVDSVLIVLRPELHRQFQFFE